MNKTLKILLVEDDNFLLGMYVDKFRTEGFEVFVADIILLDVMLPKMNGFEVLRELQKDADIKNIPVILLTNLSQNDDVKKGLELGAKDFLIKAHFMPQEVVAKVKKILSL